MSPSVSVHNRFRAQDYVSQECRAFVRSVELIHHQVVKGLFNFLPLAPQLELPLSYSWNMAHCFQHDNSICTAGLQFSLHIVVKHNYA